MALSFCKNKIAAAFSRLDKKEGKGGKKGDEKAPAASAASTASAASAATSHLFLAGAEHVGEARLPKLKDWASTRGLHWCVGRRVGAVCAYWGGRGEGEVKRLWPYSGVGT